MRTEPSVRDYLDKTYVLRALKLFLLAHAAPETVHKLAETALDPSRRGGRDAVRRRRCRRSAVPAAQRLDDAVAHGADDREVIVSYCPAGKFVDLVGCQSGMLARTVTARATVASEALSIDYVSFCDLQAEDKQLEQQVQRESKEQLAQYTQMQSVPEASEPHVIPAEARRRRSDERARDRRAALRRLRPVRNRVRQSTHEGVSRLDRKAGPSFYSLHLPTSCRHCEHPHCMTDCPPNAIHRMPNGEVFIDDTCIGCGNCEENCPYGVIQMAEMGNTQPSLLQRLLGKHGAATAPRQP